MSKSLYLKYRPHNFANLVGQDVVKRTLVSSILAGEVAHAYLFSGPRGTGKTSSARLVARALNCLSLIDGYEPCGECEICKEINDGRLTDLIEIDAASNRGIDEIRDLKEKINYLPSRAKCKVYIIDEVHMLTKEAFNALLKTLEEPPEHAYFILATTELHKIPETVVSRCQRFDFKRVSDVDIMERLSFIAKEEKIEVEEGLLELISERVSGGMRDSISLFDQLSSDGKASLANAREVLGMAEFGLVKELFVALESNDRNRGLAVVADAYKKGVDFEFFCHDILKMCREKMLGAVGSGDEKMLNRVIGWVDSFTKAKLKLDKHIPQLSLEVAVIENTGANERQKVDKVVVKEEVAEVIEEKPEMKEKLILEEKEIVETKEEVVVEKRESKVGADIDELEKRWQEIIATIKKPSFRMSMKNARPVRLEGEVLTVAFDTNFHKAKLDVAENQQLLEEKMKAALGSVFKVIGEVTAKSNKEIKKRAEEALGIFGGEVLD